MTLTGATLGAPTALTGFTPVFGQIFTIISGGPNAVVGTFAGLAEGGLVTGAGTSFKVSYVGGTSGHDVTLTTQQIGGPVTHYSITATGTGPFTPGTPVSFTITGLDNGGIPGTGGTPVTITSSDSTAVLPSPVALSNSTATFSVTFNATTAGPQTVTGTNGTSTGSVTVQIGPSIVQNVASSFSVTPAAGTQTTGAPFNVTVTVLDQTGSPFPGFTGTVAISSTDPAASP